MTKKLFYLVIAALAVRLLVVYFQYSGDIRNHIAWGQSVLSAGTIGFFSRHFSGFNDANYPPITILVFTLFRFLYQVSNSLLTWLNFQIKFFPSFLIPLSSTLNMQAVFLKLPAIFADLGIGILLYQMFAKKRTALLVSALYLLNPAIIYVSAVWGQIESIPLFFLLLSYYFLARVKSHYYLSHLAFVAALLSKQTALWLLPVFLILWFKQGSTRSLLKGLILQLIVFVLFYLPFTLSLNPFSLYLATLSGSSTLVSDQALNLWYFVFNGGRVEDSVIWLDFSVRLWSIILLGTIGASICLRLWKKFSLERAASSLFWISMIAFFLQTRVHERHLGPALVFLLTTNYQPKWKILFYFFLSAYYMYNLYLSLRLPFI